MRHLVLDSEETVGEAFPSVVAARTDDSNRDIGVKVDAPSLREIVNISNSIGDREREGEKFFSLELFPSKIDDKEVYQRFFSEVSRRSSPLFYALTWHDHNLPLESLRHFPSNTLLHIAAKKLKKPEVVKILNDVFAQGKTNIFVLRGDGATGAGDFAHALDLVKFVRQRYSSKFVICVAGYPQMHPESVSKEVDLMHLKDKVDAGANFIITQIFFESKLFVEFVRSCRGCGITVPIIPGIFPIPSYRSLQKMAKLCSVEIPSSLMKELKPIKDDDQAVRVYGIDLARKLIADIFDSGAASGFHLFTLNRASVALDVCADLFE